MYRPNYSPQENAREDLATLSAMGLNVQETNRPRSVHPSATWDGLAALLDFAPDASIVINSAGRIVLLNVQIDRLFGYRQEELIGHPLELLLPERLRAGHTRQRTDYMHAAQPRPMGIGLQLVGRRKDGSEFPVDVSLRPVLVEQSLYVIGAVRDMTAQRLAEQERTRNAERLHQQDQLISLAHDAILVRHPASHIISWNKGAEKLYGWAARQAIGKATHDLLQTRFPVSPEAVNQALERHGQWEGELIHTRRDGSQVIVESRQVLVRDDQGIPSAILEINRDITERRRLERLEQEVQAKRDAHLHVLQTILDRLPFGVFLAQGSELRLVMANRAANTLWGAEWQPGLPREVFLRQQGVRFLTPDGRALSATASPVGQAMLSGEPVLHRQMVISQPDGTRLPILVDAIPLEGLDLFSHPRETGVAPPAERVVLVAYQDVTPLKEAEELKDQFVSLATHELRTPVTIIAGYIDLLLVQATPGKGHELDSWQHEKVRQVKQAAWQLARLTEDLLDVSRMQAVQFELERHPTDLVALTRQVVEHFQATTQSHHLSLHTTLAELYAPIDACRIEQVLSNLLSNAVKYSPNGGLIEVTLERDPEEHEARFRIRDQGIGIPREQQARLFGRFMRAENARAARIDGTGLGLYLCREMIERHGGKICFESEEGAGSTFSFSLPCATGIE